MERLGLIFLSAWALLYNPLSSCSAITDFVENKKGGRKFNTSNPVFDKYIARFEELGREYTGDKFFQVGDIPINFGDTENPLYDGVCFSYSNGEKEIIIKKSWWDKHEKDEETQEGDTDKETVNEAPGDGGEDKGKQEKKDSYSLIQESLLFHELGHCRLGRKHEEATFDSDKEPGIKVKKSMMSHNIVTSNSYRKYKEGYWEELFTGSTEKLENLIKP